jgi:1-acyl-sn-glycerol-3-phosphate acyltransferase
MATLRAGFIFVTFLLLTVLLMPVQVLLLRLPGHGSKGMAQFYHRLVCWLFGVRVTVVGTPAQGGVLMVANHSGWLDIPILTAVAPVSFVAKAEVGQWAFFGTLARLQQTIFIRRARSKAAEDRDNIRRRLLDGDALVIFPEGTSSDGNRVLGFRSALLSAAELPLGEDKGYVRHAPVQPVSIAYVALYGIPMGRENRPFFAWYGDMELVPHLWEALESGPIDVTVEFHQSLTIDEAGDRKALATRCEAAVRSGLIRALAGSEAEAVPPAADEGLDEAEADAEEIA